jgi:hypothetical protein
VDKLVKVWRKNGREVWVLLHVEVQTQRQSGFGRRMYEYNTRIFDHFGRTVVSVAVLADDNPGWRPKSYEEALWGWSVGMIFPAVKLLDWADRDTELETHGNPFARIVLAHLRFAIEKGMLIMIEDLLRIRLGDEGPKLLPEITALDDPDKYRAMLATISKAASVEEVRLACAAAAAAPEPAKKKTRGKRR